MPPWFYQHGNTPLPLSPSLSDRRKLSSHRGTHLTLLGRRALLRDPRQRVSCVCDVVDRILPLTWDREAARPEPPATTRRQPSHAPRYLLVDPRAVFLAARVVVLRAALDFLALFFLNKNSRKCDGTLPFLGLVTRSSSLKFGDDLSDRRLSGFKSQELTRGGRIGRRL